MPRCSAGSAIRKRTFLAKSVATAHPLLRVKIAPVPFRKGRPELRRRYHALELSRQVAGKCPEYALAWAKCRPTRGMSSYRAEAAVNRPLGGAVVRGRREHGGLPLLGRALQRLAEPGGEHVVGGADFLDHRVGVEHVLVRVGHVGWDQGDRVGLPDVVLVAGQPADAVDLAGDDHDAAPALGPLRAPRPPAVHSGARAVVAGGRDD